MKPKRYSFRVVIEQADPEENRNFVIADDWAYLIRQRLREHIMMADIVEVTPIRNRVRGTDETSQVVGRRKTSRTKASA